MTKQTREPEYELGYCKVCGQMTNHYDDGRCAKCVKRDLDTFGSNNEGWHVFWSGVLGGVSFLIGGLILWFVLGGIVTLIKMY
jgi:hypothetical protein